MDRNTEERCREILSIPRDYSDEEIREFLYEFSSKTGLYFRDEVPDELPDRPIKEQIYFFVSMLIYLNHYVGNEESDKKIKVSEEDMKDLSLHIAYIIGELSKDIK